MYGYVYKFTLIPTGKIYVGKHACQKFNEEYLGSGVYWNRAINKYGKENILKEILCWCSSPEELDEKEKFYIDYLNARNSDIGYNIALGGDGGDTWSGHTEADKLIIGKKISSKNKGKRLVILSKESLLKMGLSQKIRIANRTEEQRQLESTHKSLAAKNRKMSEEAISNAAAKCIESKRRNGTLAQSDSTKQKLREANLGKKSLYRDGEYRICSNPDEIKQLINEGWIFKGRPHIISDSGRKSFLEKSAITRSNRTAEYQQELRTVKSNRMSGEGNPMYGSTFVWMNNGKVNKRVDPELFETFLTEGFVRGKINYKSKTI